jgi:hypothetical protein
MDDFLKVLGPLAGVFVGWLLTELSSYMRGTREDRRAYSKALSELLEVWHLSWVLDKGFAEIEKEMGLPRGVLITATQAIKVPFFDTSGISERYNQAVTDVASADPLLAFQLRSKNLVADWMLQVQVPTGGTPEESKVAAEIERYLSPKMIGAVEEVLQSLAWKCGWGVWFRVRCAIKRKGKDKMLSEYIEFVKKKVSEQMKGGVRTVAQEVQAVVLEHESQSKAPVDHGSG